MCKATAWDFSDCGCLYYNTWPRYCKAYKRVRNGEHYFLPTIYVRDPLWDRVNRNFPHEDGPFQEICISSVALDPFRRPEDLLCSAFEPEVIPSPANKTCPLHDPDPEINPHLKMIKDSEEFRTTPWQDLYIPSHTFQNNDIVYTISEMTGDGRTAFVTSSDIEKDVHQAENFKAKVDEYHEQQRWPKRNNNDWRSYLGCLLRCHNQHLPPEPYTGPSGGSS